MHIHHHSADILVAENPTHSNIGFMFHDYFVQHTGRNPRDDTYARSDACAMLATNAMRLCRSSAPFLCFSLCFSLCLCLLCLLLRLQRLLAIAPNHND